jgi:hypothetical protein
MASHLYDAVVALRAELAKDTLHTYELTYDAVADASTCTCIVERDGGTQKSPS